MKIRTSHLISAILFILMTQTLVFGCVCVDLGNPMKEKVAEWLKSSTVVFSGEVIKLEKVPETQATIVTFDVDEIWKGTSSPVIEVLIPMSSCGYEFQIKTKYLVYAWGASKALQTGQCTGNSKHSDDFGKEQLPYLGKGKSPERQK